MALNYPEKGKYTHFYVSNDPYDAIPDWTRNRMLILGEFEYKDGYCTGSPEFLKTGERINDPATDGFEFVEYVKAYNIRKEEISSELARDSEDDSYDPVQICKNNEKTNDYDFPNQLLYPIGSSANDPSQYYGGWLQGPQRGAGTPVAPVAAGLMFGSYAISYIGYFWLANMLREQLKDDDYKRIKAAELFKIHPGAHIVSYLVNEEQKTVLCINEIDSGVYGNGNVWMVKDSKGNPLDFNMARVYADGSDGADHNCLKLERLRKEKFDAIAFPWIAVIRKGGSRAFDATMKFKLESEDEDGNSYEALLAQAINVKDGDGSRAYVIGGTYAISRYDLDDKKFKSIEIKVSSRNAKVWGHIFPIFINNITPTFYLTTSFKPSADSWHDDWGTKHYDDSVIYMYHGHSDLYTPVDDSPLKINRFVMDFDINNNAIKPISCRAPCSIQYTHPLFDFPDIRSKLYEMLAELSYEIEVKNEKEQKETFITAIKNRYLGHVIDFPRCGADVIGRVRDINGNNIEAELTLTAKSSDQHGTGIINSTNGIYIFPTLHGPYTLTVKKTGYEEQVREFNIEHSENKAGDLRLDFILKKSGGAGRAIQGLITGRVKNIFGNSIEGATVNIPEIGTEHSNEDGMFSYGDVDTNVYTATVTYPEYITQHKRVKVIGYQTAWLDCTLEPQYYIADQRIYELHLPDCARIKNLGSKNKKKFSTIQEALNQEYYGCSYCLGESYVGNQRTYELHLPDCRWAKLISSKNKKEFPTIRDALKLGYNGCYYCLRGYNVEERYFIANSNPLKMELHRPNCILVNRIYIPYKTLFNSLKNAFDRGYKGCRYCLNEYNIGDITS